MFFNAIKIKLKLAIRGFPAVFTLSVFDELSKITALKRFLCRIIHCFVSDTVLNLFLFYFLAFKILE